MVSKKQVLELISERTREKSETSFRSLVREFDLSIEAACGHLQRLWMGRLIEPTQPRFGGSRFRLEPGEKLQEIRFRVTKRGLARLAWYRDQDREGWFA